MADVNEDGHEEANKDRNKAVNPEALRFLQLIGRSAKVARMRINADGAAAPLTDEARDRALNVLSYALKTAEAWPETCNLLLTLAPKMEQAGHRNGWIRYLQDGLIQSQSQGDRLAEADLQFQCGYLYRLMSQYAQAQSLLSTSIFIYAELGETQKQARSLNQLAYLAWQQHHYDKAEQQAHEALILVDDTSLEKAMSLSVLGLVATNRSLYPDAEKYHSSALLIRTQQAVPKEMAWSLQNVGIALREQGKLGLAIEHFQKALALLDKAHDPAHEAIIQMNLGGAYHAQGDHHQALGVILVAEVGLRRVSDEYNLAKLLTIKGLCYLALHQGSLAEHAFKASSALFQQLNDLSWYLNAFDGLGISYLEQAQYDQALTIFESIAAQLPEIKDTPAHKYLTATITIQIAQAKSKKIEREKLVYVST